MTDRPDDPSVFASLTPESRQVLAQMTEVPALGSVSIEETRQISDAPRTRSPEDSPPLASVRDHHVDAGTRTIPIRVYSDRPSEVDRRDDPIVVFFHGGGWVLCNIETHDSFCRRLAKIFASTVVSVEYRRAPEAPFPAAADDALGAVRSVSGTFGRERSMFVCGDSSGGNLAAVTARRARDEGISLNGQILLYPVLDSERNTASYRDLATGFYLTASAMRWFWDLYVPKTEMRRHPDASPRHAQDLEGVAPALIITASHDPLRDEGEAYARQLLEAGVPVLARRVRGVIHGFATMGGSPESASVVSDIGRFVEMFK